jgi:outer membrane protein assembly factor BamD (BamD/ComL family)
VRDHLTAGRTTQALSEIQRYRAQWPRGALAAEAAILRVDALLRSGNRAEADREAEALIKRAPESRYATRARALLGYKPE